MTAPALITLAHGSRDPRSAATIASLTELVRCMRPDLRVEESFDEELRRYLRTARLVDETSVLPIPGRPELRDARLVAMSPLAFTLAGFERIEGADYAQSWIVTK